MNLLDKIFYKEKVAQQTQDILSGEYKHFQCESGCANHFSQEVMSQYCLRMKNKQHRWSEKEAERFHNRWRECKHWKIYTDGGF